MDVLTIEKNINIVNLIKNIPGGFCIYIEKSEDIEFIIWNKYMVEITGYTMQEINKIGWNNILYNNDLFSDFINKVKLNQENEYEIISKSGTKKTISISTSIINTEDGKENTLALIKDITKNKQLEQELREIEERYDQSELMLRQVTENSLDMITISDINGTIQYGTPSNKDTLGYDIEDFVGLNVLDLVHPNDLSYTEIQLEEMRTTFQEKMIQCSLKCKDGSYKCLEIRGKVLKNGETIEGFIFSARDISERVKVEKELKESEEKYKHLIEFLPFGVYILNKDKIIFSNKVGLDYLGVSNLDTIKDKRYLEIVQPHPSYEENHKKSIEKIKSNKYNPLTEEKFIRIVDNKILDFKTVVTKYPYDNKKNKYLLVLMDNSDKKKAEELEKDMREKSRLLSEASEYEKLRTEFFANISHELKTPINVILSSLQLLSLKTNKTNEICWFKEEYKKYPEIMKQNCYRLIRLINNLIDVTKIDSGYFNLNLINTNIVSIIEDITLSVVDYAENKGISLIFDTDIEEKILACDPDKIERIILNLISNAIKFTEPNGNILVSIIDKGNDLIISIKDTGIGISKDKQQMIFERFIQVDKSLARNRYGSGIGLALVKSLVEMHKGTISVESELNKGSEFIIKLPIYLIDKEIDNENSNNYFIQENPEKINIEFSDIYY